MTKRVYVDRSRYETGQRCLRARWYEYHEGGVGITSARKPLPLAVGGAVHAGLAELLHYGGDAYERIEIRGEHVRGGAPIQIEERAVKAALADFVEYQNALERPDTEAVMISPTQSNIPGMDSVSEIGFVMADQQRGEIDQYLYDEQSALVEAMVRAYARRRLRPLLDEFEVLEVEREGEWELHVEPHCIRTGDDDVQRCGWCGFRPRCSADFDAPCWELWFMSRPDALLRHRTSNELYLLSYKTAASWDVRKARDAEHDMQGMSEGIEVERRLAGWWENIHHTIKAVGEPKDRSKWDYHYPNSETIIPNAMCNFLLDLDAPPRIHAVRYEYMLKGERWKDKDLSARFGVDMRSQKSHLIRQYVAVSVPMRGTAGYNIGDTCWSWDYVREDGRDGSLAWQNWKSRSVWDQPGAVRAWIDKLDDAAETMSGEDSTMGMEPRLLGYKCDAQALGVTVQHPLDAIFIPPIVVYRNSDELRDLVDQMEAVERRVAEGVAAVREAEGTRDEGEVRHALNVHFPQTRRACEYPTTCQFSRVCYGGEDIRRDPVATGLYKIRVPNHPVESGGDGAQGYGYFRIVRRGPLR